MSREILPFQFETHAVRVVLDVSGAPWFVAGDIADVLGYRKANDMTRSLDDDEKGAHILRTLGGDQTVTIISESGLYHAILKSRKPEVKTFRRWVTHEVLPTIRKTGGYRLSGTTRSITDDEIHAAERLSRLMAPYLRIFTRSRMRGEVLRAALERTMLNVHGIDLNEVLPIPEMSDAKAHSPLAVVPKERAEDFLRVLWASPLPNGITVEQAISRVVHTLPAHDLDGEAMLARIGIAVKVRGDRSYLAIAVRHPGLAQVLRGTRWHVDGSWGSALRGIPGIQAKTARIRGVATSAHFVPLDALPMPLDTGRAV